MNSSIEMLKSVLEEHIKMHSDLIKLNIENEELKKENNKLIENEKDFYKVSSIVTIKNQNTKLCQEVELLKRTNSYLSKENTRLKHVNDVSKQTPVEDTPQVVDTPTVEDTPTQVEDTPQVVDTPTVEDTPTPVDDDTPTPVDDDTPTQVEDTPQVVDTPTPVDDDTPTPVDDDTPTPVDNDTPTVEDNPTVDDTPPPVDDAQIMKTLKYKNEKYLVDLQNIIYEYNIDKKGLTVLGEKIVKPNNKFSVKFY
jgi:FtsZ-binding cell division protein ZapB